MYIIYNEYIIIIINLSRVCRIGWRQRSVKSWHNNETLWVRISPLLFIKSLVWFNNLNGLWNCEYIVAGLSENDETGNHSWLKINRFLAWGFESLFSHLLWWRNLVNAIDSGSIVQLGFESSNLSEHL